jgi:hypothetical protein
MLLSTKGLMLGFLEKLIFTPVFNNLMIKVWKNVGVLEWAEVRKSGDIVSIKTRNEFVSRLVGCNRFSIGVYKGIFGSLLGHKVMCMHAVQNREECMYEFRAGAGSADVPSKSKELYDSLNRAPGNRGHALKDALRVGVLSIDYDGHIRFRGNLLVNGENTIFHLLGSKCMLMDKLADISHAYFRGLVGESSGEKKLVLLKTLIQSMGWGTTAMIMHGKNDITVSLSNLPCGMQTEKENYDFIAYTMLGYVRLINEGMSIKRKCSSGNTLSVHYTTSARRPATRPPKRLQKGH